MGDFIRARLVRPLVSLVVCTACIVSCGGGDDNGGDPSPNNSGRISTDDQLFALVTQTDPFAAYTLFPNADSVTAGMLNGSEAHRAMVRVSLNAKAIGALENGRLPAGGSFPDSSIIFKEIRGSTGLVVYAVMYKDRANPLAANGWLWAEYRPAGAVIFSISQEGNGCTSCHARDDGPANDHVRTFERQR